MLMTQNKTKNYGSDWWCFFLLDAPAPRSRATLPRPAPAPFSLTGKLDAPAPFSLTGKLKYFFIFILYDTLYSRE
jgi:hypothetical protein